MGQLHELLAARQRVGSRADSALMNAEQVFKGQQLFEALLQTYQHLEEDPSGLHREPPKVSNMVTTVPEVLKSIQVDVSPLFDLLYQIDKTNMEATATLAVGDLKLENLPTTFLLQLEKSLDKLKDALAKTPTHDAKYSWSPDQERGSGVFTTDPVKTYRTTKKMRHDVIVAPTKEHPAEIRERTEDIVTGEVTKQLWSGKSSVKDKNTMLRKMDDLLVALKKSLAHANRVDHNTSTVAEDIFGYLFGHYKTE